MTPIEVYQSKRKHFIENTLKYFHFLVSEYNYAKQEHETILQENGAIILDQFKYMNAKNEMQIIISNQYHPYNYGFSIEICDPKNESGEAKIIYYKLKEEQDIEQSYIAEAAESLGLYLQNDNAGRKRDDGNRS
jgi:hypothetical protein